MDTTPSTTFSGTGRATGFILGFVVFVCMTMIAATGYVKYQLDHAEGVMAAPGSAFVSDQEAYEKLRRTLGYSGFVGFAQNFAATHDSSSLSDMRAQEKLADNMIAHLPERTPGESRHDLQAILAVFDGALQKADKSPNDFTSADMVPLYAALPVLDSRLESAAAANRLEAQEKLQFWSMLLTLTSWCSLIIASALAAGIYLTLRGRNSAPLRALAQSVRNMARGDMRTPIWGMERQDMVGELSRAIDLARYHFSQLPDMSLLSDQGPVRLRFEGNTRSLFEAMMRVISRDSEQVRTQATALADAVTKQQEAITLISSRVEAVLHNVEKRGLDGDHQVRQVLQSMHSSAQSLKHAQEHATDQLNRILPYLQERAHGMAEITQITGKQVAQILAALTLSERGLRASAEQSEEAIKKLSTTADNLGERMFGAVNLLQAGGKVLAETTEKTQSRLNEAIETLNDGMTKLTVPPPAPEPPPVMLDVSPRLEAVAAALEIAHKKLEDELHVFMQTARAAPAPETEIEAVPVQEPAFVDSLMTEIKSGFDATTRRIEQMQQQYESLRDTKTEAPPQEPAFVDNLMVEIKSGFASTTRRIEEVQKQYEALHELAAKPKAEPAAKPPAYAHDLMLEIKAGFETVSRQIGTLREQYAAATLTAGATPSGADEQLRNQWYQMAGQLEATRVAIEQTITQQMERLESRLGALKSGGPQVIDPEAFGATQQQMEQQTQILTELVATLGVLDAHMQQLKSEIGQRDSKASA